MYEKVKEFLVEKGFKKHKSTSLLFVRDDMLFVLSPQGVKNQINIWFAIYPLALPELWINMGWGPAAGSFPEDGVFSNESDDVDALMINELEEKVLPFINNCHCLSDLEKLYSKGNIKAQYPRVFALFAMKEYKKAQALLNKMLNEFENGGLCLNELDTLKKFSVLSDQDSIDEMLEKERKNNIKKYSLVRHIKKLSGMNN